jgi:conjugative transfer signal peptidase TraF
MKTPTPKEVLTTLAAVLTLTLVASTASALVARHLLVNRTESMPVGLYWMSAPRAAPHAGDRVAFAVPASIRPLVRERGYLQPEDLMLKHVVAIRGDHVCTAGGMFVINDSVYGHGLARDAQGRELPQHHVCGPVPEGQLYVATPHPRSLDSRTFGPISVAEVRGKVTPLWTL